MRVLCGLAVVLGFVGWVRGTGVELVGSTSAGTRSFFLDCPQFSSGAIYVFQPNAVSAEIDAIFDPSASTLTYVSQSFAAQGMTYQQTKSLTAGSGATEDITLSLHIDAGTATQTDLGPFTMAPTAGGVYRLYQDLYPGTWSINVTGSYTLTGPTQSISGTFAEQQFAYLWLGVPPNWEFDPTGLPGSGKLVGDQVLSWNPKYPDPNVIDATVDGVPITVSLPEDEWSFGSSSVILTAVPEPIQLGLVIGAGLFIYRRKPDRSGH